MANPLDRTWYNTLVDDDGSGTTGTIWNKAAVDSLLDAVDASLVNVIDKTGGPGTNQVALFLDGDTLKATPAIAGDPANGGLILTSPSYCYITLGDSSQPANSRLVRMINSGGLLTFQTHDDAGSPVAGQSVAITRSGRLQLNAGQLTFPTTPLPSADPYTFDDYREILWTPTITGAGGSSGQAYALQYGGGLKWGRYVVLTFNVALSTLGTISGGVGIGNLPISTDTSANYTQSFPVEWQNLATALVHASAGMDPGLPTFLRLYGVAAAATTSLGASLVQANLTNTSAFYGTIVYRTTN